VTAAYGDTVSAGWHTGAGVVYEPLAAALVATCPVPLDGAVVLDAGSGSGAVASLVAAAGATVVASDLSRSMIAAQPGRSWPAAVADVLALPFPSDAFHAAIAAFLVNHLDPEAALGEMARVVRAGGAVAASTWADRPDAIKAAIDRILAGAGWKPPDWYRVMKSVVLPVSGDPDRLGAAAERAGLVDIAVSVHAEVLGVSDPVAVVGYRVATPHIAPWLSGLDSTTRHGLIAAAAAAIEPLLAEWRPAAVFLYGRVPDQPSRRSAARANASR
jgi:SAM-dependent methyltransferase